MRRVARGVALFVALCTGLAHAFMALRFFERYASMRAHGERDVLVAAEGVFMSAEEAFHDGLALAVASFAWLALAVLGLSAIERKDRWALKILLGAVATEIVLGLAWGLVFGDPGGRLVVSLLVALPVAVAAGVIRWRSGVPAPCRVSD